MNISLILLVLLVVVIAYLIITYNFFVSTKTRVNASVQEIGNQLKRQADLIPNLEASVKGYLEHEKSILEMLAEARKLIAKGQDATKQISEVLPKLQVVVESNPQLKADGVVTKLMDELRDTSDKVMYSRRLMIDLTADYNTKRVSVPSNLVANLFKFEELKGLETPELGDFLKVSSKEMETPKVSI